MKLRFLAEGVGVIGDLDGRISDGTNQHEFSFRRIVAMREIERWRDSEREIDRQIDREREREREREGERERGFDDIQDEIIETVFCSDTVVEIKRYKRDGCCRNKGGGLAKMTKGWR